MRSPAPESLPQPPPGERPLRVAVVGSGLAGLTTAYLLRRRGAEVWLVEKRLMAQSSKLGFHSESLEIGPDEGEKGGRVGGAGRPTVVDVPMRSFQGGYYPLLLALYAHLGLAVCRAHFTFSFARPRAGAGASAGAADQDVYFIHAGASGLAAPSLPVRAYRSPRALWMALATLAQFAFCYVLLVALAFAEHHGLNPHARGTLGELVDAVDARLARAPLLGRRLAGAFPRFAHDVVVPLFSAVGTMPAPDVLATPASAVLGYIHLTVATSHYALRDASARDVAGSLAAPVVAQGAGHVRLGTATTGLRRRADRALAVCLGDGAELEVDRVVIAAPARAAAQLLGSLEPSLVVAGDKSEVRRVARMRRALGEVQYRDAIVVTHRDASILPAKGDRREINLFQPPYDRCLSSSPSPPADDARSRPPAPRQSRIPSSPSATEPSARSASSSSRRASPRSSRSPSPRASSATSTRPSTPSSPAPAPHFDPAREAYTMATHIMAPGVYQTTDPVVPIASAAVLGVARLERALPVARAETLANLRPAAAGGGAALVHLAGAYAYPGIPLLEGCVGSARRVVDEIMGADGGDGSGPQRGPQPDGIDWDAGRGGWARRAWTWQWTST